MEDNFTDKELRDKLKSVEFPFDPKAWEQMETMLDEKKKRRGIFWGWFGGVAVGLLLGGMIGYEATQFAVSGLQSPVNTERSQRQGDLARSSKVTSNTNSAPVKVENKAEVSDQHNKELANNINPANDKGDSQNSMSAIQSGEHSDAKTNKGQTGNSAGSANKGSGSGLKKLSVANKPGETFATTSKPGGEQVEVTASIRNPALLSEIYLEGMKADELNRTAQNNEIALEGKDEDFVLPKKKRIFHYSIGVIANTTFTTLGNQVNQPNDLSSQRVTHPHVSSAPFFYKSPSYGAGLTQEFMFGKRLAITNSFLLSQTSYRVFYTDKPYTANATELDIPLGLKVYPVSRSRFRFYIESGYINHFTLEQSVTYAPSYSKLSVLPYYTNPLGPSFTSQSVKIRQYYGSFYASSGVECIVKRRLVFFTAPLFYMSLGKIAELESHKYNLGLDAGIRYQF